MATKVIVVGVLMFCLASRLFELRSTHQHMSFDDVFLITLTLFFAILLALDETLAKIVKRKRERPPAA